MSTSRVKRSGTRRLVTNATLKPFDGNGNSDVKQSKVTQYFSTVQRGSTTSVKRLKLEAPTTEQESVFSSVVPEQAIKSEKFDKLTTILSDVKTEDDLEKSICAE
ncbi:unnamed protein product, partial [Anisakis simplex]|uniref:WAPL domain-containing protein n=1 Tax=Anisakis simplex TaxID=6269 RepID=A0A0M3KDE5_ANISI